MPRLSPRATRTRTSSPLYPMPTSVASGRRKSARPRRRPRSRLSPPPRRPSRREMQTQRSSGAANRRSPRLGSGSTWVVSSHSSFTSGRRWRSRQRCTSLRQPGGTENSRSCSISTLPGQSRIFTWQSTTSRLPMAMRFHAPKEAADLVHVYPAASSTFMLRCSFWVPLRLAFISSAKCRDSPLLPCNAELRDSAPLGPAT